VDGCSRSLPSPAFLQCSPAPAYQKSCACCHLSQQVNNIIPQYPISFTLLFAELVQHKITVQARRCAAKCPFMETTTNDRLITGQNLRSLRLSTHSGAEHVQQQQDMFNNQEHRIQVPVLEDVLIVTQCCGCALLLCLQVHSSCFETAVVVVVSDT
jgi:hypothetical protein